MNPTPSPGRVVATLYDGEADRGHASSPPIDTHVYDEWTAEAEAEARELLGPELAVQADDGGSLEAELPPVPTRSEGSTRTQWLLVRPWWWPVVWPASAPSPWAPSRCGDV
jgi:hypothetical protein